MSKRSAADISTDNTETTTITSTNTNPDQIITFITSDNKLFEVPLSLLNIMCNLFKNAPVEMTQGQHPIPFSHELLSEFFAKYYSREPIYTKIADIKKYEKLVDYISMNKKIESTFFPIITMDFFDYDYENEIAVANAYIEEKNIKNKNIKNENIIENLFRYCSNTTGCDIYYKINLFTINMKYFPHYVYSYYTHKEEISAAIYRVLLCRYLTPKISDRLIVD
jgi:hypothetical protein